MLGITGWVKKINFQPIIDDAINKHGSKAVNIKLTKENNVKGYIDLNEQFQEIFLRHMSKLNISSEKPLIILNLGSGLAMEIPAVLAWAEKNGKKIARYILIELDSTLVEKAKKLYKAFPNVEIYQGDAANLAEIVKKTSLQQGSVHLGMVRHPNFSTDLKSFTIMFKVIFPYFIDPKEGVLFASFYFSEERDIFFKITEDVYQKDEKDNRKAKTYKIPENKCLAYYPAMGKSLPQDDFSLIMKYDATYQSSNAQRARLGLPPLSARDVMGEHGTLVGSVYSSLQEKPVAREVFEVVDDKRSWRCSALVLGLGTIGLVMGGVGGATIGAGSGIALDKMIDCCTKESPRMQR